MSVQDSIWQAVQQVFSGSSPAVLQQNYDLAIATATQESGLNPTAIGDNGTSFGLFQLHKGGELGALSITQAFDPLVNSVRALTEFKSVESANPGLLTSNPGQLAAKSQRPANQSAYAAAVNKLLGNNPTPSPSSASSSSPQPTDTAGAVGGITANVGTFVTHAGLFLVGVAILIIALIIVVKHGRNE